MKTILTPKGIIDLPVELQSTTTLGVYYYKYDKKKYLEDRDTVLLTGQRDPSENGLYVYYGGYEDGGITYKYRLVRLKTDWSSLLMMRIAYWMTYILLPIRNLKVVLKTFFTTELNAYSFMGPTGAIGCTGDPGPGLDAVFQEWRSAFPDGKIEHFLEWIAIKLTEDLMTFSAQKVPDWKAPTEYDLSKLEPGTSQPCTTTHFGGSYSFVIPPCASGQDVHEWFEQTRRNTGGKPLSEVATQANFEIWVRDKYYPHLMPSAIIRAIDNGASLSKARLWMLKHPGKTLHDYIKSFQDVNEPASCSKHFDAAAPSKTTDTRTLRDLGLYVAKDAPMEEISDLIMNFATGVNKTDAQKRLDTLYFCKKAPEIGSSVAIMSAVDAGASAQEWVSLSDQYPNQTAYLQAKYNEALNAGKTQP